MMNRTFWLHALLGLLLMAAGSAWAQSGTASHGMHEAMTHTTKALTHASHQKAGHDCCDTSLMACCDEPGHACGIDCAIGHCTTAPSALLPVELVVGQPAGRHFTSGSTDRYTSRFIPPLTPPPLV